MDVFETLRQHQYGQLHFSHDEESGLQAIIAIHNLNRGPGLGGTRCVTYSSTDAAIFDAVRLARGMSYKAALAGLPHGGGKAVLVKPNTIDDRAALFRAFGAFVDSLGGQYITTEDSGTSPNDMDVIATQTDFVVGCTPAHGGSGDPSPWTARGVLRGIEACVQVVLGRDELTGLHVAIQGVGHVGYSLATQLHAAGARLTVADVVEENTQRAADELGAEVVSVDDILSVECDVLSPCALGAVINSETEPALRCRIVAGAANNQLLEDRHGDLLAGRGIVYAPDYAINAGGLISVAQEWAGYDEDKVREKVDGIYDTIRDIVSRARAEDKPTWRIADQRAEAAMVASS